MSDPNLPSMGDLEAARASQQARVVSVDQVLEMKRQARQIAMEILVQASAAAAAGGLPIPEEIVGTLSEKIVDHAVGFLSGLADAG